MLSEAGKCSLILLTIFLLFTLKLFTLKLNPRAPCKQEADSQLGQGLSLMCWGGEHILVSSLRLLFLPLQKQGDQQGRVHFLLQEADAAAD